MLVRFTHDGQIVTELEASVSWSATAARDLGRADIKVPRTSPAWNAAYINDEGGFLVELYTAAGGWRGVADRPIFSADGASISVLPLETWLEGRLVQSSRSFRCLPAGAIAERAVLDGVAGLGSAAIMPGTFCLSGPVVPTYSFNGKSVLQVLTDMHDATGQEWELDRFGRINWLPFQGTYRERHLIDDGVIFGPWQYNGAGLRDVTHDVIQVDHNGIIYVAVSNSGPPLWPREAKA